MKKLVILLILLILIGLVIGVVAFLVSRSTNVPRGLQSIPAKNLEDSGMMMWKESDWSLKDTPDGFDIFMLGWGFRSFDQKAKWDYKTTPFWASIDSKPEPSFRLSITFLGPDKMPYLGIQKDVDVMACTRDNSFLTVEKPKMIAGDVIFFDHAKIGDSLIGYCLNAKCTKVGKMCKLYRFEPL